jgi:hypothetical protein
VGHHTYPDPDMQPADAEPVIAQPVAAAPSQPPRSRRVNRGSRRGHGHRVARRVDDRVRARPRVEFAGTRRPALRGWPSRLRRGIGPAGVPCEDVSA